MALPKEHRLVIDRTIRSTLRERGKFFQNDLLRANYLIRPENKQKRFGIVIGVSLSKKATVRNKLRRYIQEAIRLFLPQAPSVDMIVYPKSTIKTAEKEAIKKSIQGLFQKIS